MFNLIKDIKSGALPPREIPSFIMFMVGRAFWPLIALIVAGMFVIVAR